MNLLRSENHLHLYGCLSAADLFEDSFDRSRKYKSRFDWFLSEFQKNTGTSIDPNLWWSRSDGFEHFKKHFLCTDHTNFQVFQAKFNLLIALHPPTPEDLTLAKKVFHAHAKEGGFKEYRTFLPLYLPPPERAQYLFQLISCARSFETSDYHPRIAISFSRNDTDAIESYNFLKSFLDNHRDLAPWITGIDFCGNERGHPPSAKNVLFNLINTERQQGVHKLEILYHVGEMWEDIALHSAARWCVEAAELGVRRLGHALALGMNPEALKGQSITENIDEAVDHLTWVDGHQNLLADHGYSPEDRNWLKNRLEINKNEGFIHWHYDDELIHHTRMFQSALLGIMKDHRPIIECCPTSNIRIGSLRQPDFHPLRRFLDCGLDVTISTDDPGIFDISLAKEANFCRNHFGITDTQFAEIEKINGDTHLIDY